jgi:hypothetical protein
MENRSLEKIFLRKMGNNFFKKKLASKRKRKKVETKTLHIKFLQNRPKTFGEKKLRNKTYNKKQKKSQGPTGPPPPSSTTGGWSLPGGGHSSAPPWLELACAVGLRGLPRSSAGRRPHRGMKLVGALAA